MGGVKNRDAKRAAAKVFSSGGGGGGSKGPSIIDKRNQEIQCPHCDRIFKQKDRLQQHIQKQHADVAADAESSATSASSSTETKVSVDSSAAAAHLASNSKAAAPTKTATKPPAPKPAPKMMDIGSKGGYYDVKSPKLILHEWLIRDKQPKARYKTLSGPNGSWLAKVVLPHPKQSDKDIVVFLPEIHAAETEDEAQQRGAVAALHRIAGDRALERTLPQQYAGLWKALTAAATVRKAKEAAAAEARAAKQAKQQAALKRRGPSTVIMAEDKRKLVEGILAEVRGEGDDGWESFGRPDAAASGARTVEAPSALEDDLVTLGFETQDAVRAVAAVTRSSGKGADLSSALDWLCLNVPEDRLPSNFAPGAAGKPISVLLKASQRQPSETGSAANLQDQDLDNNDLLQDPAVLELSRYGYPPAIAAQALEVTGGRVQDAVQILYNRLLGRGGGTSSVVVEVSDDCLSEWTEERIALEAIYGGEVHFPSSIWTSIHCRVLLEGDAAESVAKYSNKSKEEVMMDGIELDLEAWAPRSENVEDAYPATAPVLGVRSRDLPPRSLLAVTKALGQATDEMLGRPMLYEIASLLQDVLPDCVVQPPTLGELLGEQSDAGVDDIAEKMEDNLEISDSNARRSHRKQQQGRARRSEGPRHQLSAKDIAAESAALLEHQNELQTSTKHAAMRAQRSKLPAFTKRAEVVAALTAPSSKVVVISGATGCGKSTQIPQYILEEAISSESGGSCNVIITQPRRISAVGLASRVAQERGERVGETVGYSVRLDSKQSKRTRLLFCTTGILLRRLLSDPTLSGCTHIVLDEVHERSIESDLLLLLLRNVLRSGANPALRVVLMSATADSELFAEYFNSVLPKTQGSSILTIPGFTHPVTDLFLEDALEATGYLVGKTSKWARKGAGKKGDDGIGGDEVEQEGETAAARTENDKYSPETVQSLQNIDETLINTDLIESLVVHVASTSVGSKNDANAILIFAPGADEIGRIVRTLEHSPKLAAVASQGVRVLPLHGGMPPSHQTRVFERPPPGVLKIVVSTNVAETSITIDDVVCVIDTGRVKEMGFDSQRGIARLQETFVSQASAKQRRGRAGRVRPGVCYRLFSRKTWNKMPVDTPPEVARAPLQALVMDVKGILKTDDVGATLAHMITPPDAAAVAQAVQSLQRVGALDPTTEELTPLGSHLTKMPCDPRVGKMLIFGAMLRCLDPILTVAAAQGHGRPVFWSPPDRREEADAAKRALTGAVASSKSDHLASVAAYNGWRAALAKGGRSAASAYCGRNFVSDQAMDAIHAGRRQYAEILADLGFVSAEYPSDCCGVSYNPGTAAPVVAAASGPPAPPSPAVLRHTAPGGVDQFAGHARIVKAVLAAGLYPQVLRVDHPAAKYQKVLGGAVEAAGEAQKVRFFDRERGRVFLHPSSINFSCGKFESGWLVYSELVQTSKVFVRECTMIPVYAVLLFGGEVSVNHSEGLVRVDGWATFKAPARIAVLVRELRAEVAALLSKKVSNPSLELSGSRVVEAMHHLLSTDGF